MEIKMELTTLSSQSKDQVAFIAERKSIMSTVTKSKCIFMCFETRYFVSGNQVYEVPYLT